MRRDLATILGLTVVTLQILQFPTASIAKDNALSKASCVRAAIKEALEIFTPDEPGASGDDLRTKATKELAESDAKEREGVRKCLNEKEVYDLGWFSYFVEHDVISECGVYPTSALDKHAEDDGDTDLLEGALNWAPVPTDDAHRSENPYFAGADAAQEKFHQDFERSKYGSACHSLIAEFGPSGTRFSGLVSRIKPTRGTAEDLAAFASAPPATEAEIQFRDLYQQFVDFRTSSAFKNCGFAACGQPHWLKRVQSLQSKEKGFAAFSTGTLARCGVSAGDLVMLGTAWVKVPGERQDASELHSLKAMDTKISECADKISLAAQDSLELIVGSPPPKRPADGMTGTYPLRTKPIVLSDGRKAIVGCVPCLNALTYIAVINGHAYAVNGFAKDHAARYSVRAGKLTMKVRQQETIEGITDESPLFDGIQSIKGCDIHQTSGLADAIGEAVMGHQCLGK